MSKKQRRYSSTNQSNTMNLYHRFLFGSIFLILLLFSFKRALFQGEQSIFEGPIYAWFICISLLLVLVVSGTMYLKGFYNSRITIVHFVAYLLPISYALSMVSPASSHGSSIGFQIHFGYAACFLIALFLTTNLKGANALIKILLSVSYILVIFGLANWFGDASFWGIFNWSETPGMVSNIYRDAVLNQGVDARLTSVFQYPNSYAALLMGIMIITLLAMVSTRKIKSLVVYSIFVVPLIVSFILTASRGAFVVLPFILFIVLPFLKFSKQLLFVIYTFIAVIISFIISSYLFNEGIDLQVSFSPAKAFLAWVVLLVFSVLFTGISLLIYKYLLIRLEAKTVKWESSRFSNFHLPAIGIVLGGLLALLLFTNTGFTNLLPDNIKSRIDSININQNSVLERGTFYQDAIRLWKDYPVTGAGGGAWKSLYEQYQNNPYTSKEAHSFYLQLLVETGVVGLLSLIILLSVVFYHFIKSYLRKSERDCIPHLSFFVLALAILVHSSLDFNMSFVILGMIVFLCLGGMLGGNELVPFRFQSKISVNRWFYSYPSILLIGSITLLIFSAIDLSSNNQYKSARDNAVQGTSLEEIFTPLNSAISKEKHPEYLDLKMEILVQLYSQSRSPEHRDELEKLLIIGNQLEPNYKPFIQRKLDLLMIDKQYDQALDLIEKSLISHPWEILYFEALANIHFQYGLDNLNNPNKAKEQWKLGLAIEQRVLAKAKGLEALPDAQTQGREFGITSNLALTLGQINYYQGDYSIAAKYLQARLDTTFDDSNDYEAALYYLAALQKQSQSDPVLMETMLATQQDKEQLTSKLEMLLNQSPLQ
ncbi:O-antigen ligase family protein [Cohnella herbarum]|uniref:O-antigen ligase-related domain-containing protein n=1 Tax=Cohnella herbarum TaxID=2728023 RepID=A0A7Z2VLQ6_9BACL|nr:O-antigen ligase family protein [Cohnella herbarum]QJD85270.1 hypothetical protein HH215_20225 [Cohnella herbarum]